MKVNLVEYNREMTRLCLSICKVEVIWKIRLLTIVKRRRTLIENKRFDLILLASGNAEIRRSRYLMELDEYELLRSKIP